jgi:hypothetical protein
MVELANRGFDQIKNTQAGDYIIVRDMDTEKTGGFTRWTISAESTRLHHSRNQDLDVE